MEVFDCVKVYYQNQCVVAGTVDLAGLLGHQTLIVVSRRLLRHL